MGFNALQVKINNLKVFKVYINECLNCPFKISFTVRYSFKFLMSSKLKAIKNH